MLLFTEPCCVVGSVALSVHANNCSPAKMTTMDKVTFELAWPWINGRSHGPMKLLFCCMWTTQYVSAGTKIHSGREVGEASVMLYAMSCWEILDLVVHVGHTFDIYHVCEHHWPGTSFYGNSSAFFRQDNVTCHTIWTVWEWHAKYEHQLYVLPCLLIP